MAAGTGEFPGRVVEEFTDSVKYLTCTDNFCIIDLFMELFFVTNRIGVTSKKQLWLKL